MSEGIESARLEAQILLSHCLSISKVQLYTSFDRPLSNNERSEFRELVKRRLKGEPTAYLIGKKEFWSMDFQVTDDVLIPRPETELIIDFLLDTITNIEKSFSVLEIGTGSGCISAAIASNFKQSSIIASDINPKSLKIAQKNIQKLGFTEQVSFLNCDLFNGMDLTFDFIISNPPYIKTSEIDNLQVEIKEFEPKVALDGGKDGLNIIKTLVNQGKNYLKEDGYLIFEINFDQTDSIKKLVSQNNRYSSFDVIKDYSDLDRVIVLK